MLPHCVTWSNSPSAMCIVNVISTKQWCYSCGVNGCVIVGTSDCMHEVCAVLLIGSLVPFARCTLQPLTLIIAVEQGVSITI